MAQSTERITRIQEDMAEIEVRMMHTTEELRTLVNADVVRMTDLHQMIAKMDKEWQEYAEKEHELNSVPLLFPHSENHPCPIPAR